MAAGLVASKALRDVISMILANVCLFADPASYVLPVLDAYFVQSSCSKGLGSCDSAVRRSFLNVGRVKASVRRGSERCRPNPVPLTSVPHTRSVCLWYSLPSTTIPVACHLAELCITIHAITLLNGRNKCGRTRGPRCDVGGVEGDRYISRI